VNDAMQVVGPSAAERGVELSDAVSAFAEELWCQADAERVRQILLNLLTNAVKFTEPGGRITVSAGTAAQPAPGFQGEGTGPWVFVRIEDTGIGIPANRIPAIFEAFEQADMSHNRVHGGSGLGLAISQSLARKMGGDLTVRSEPGTGSAFFLWLPATPAVPVGEPKPRVRDDLGPGAGVLKELRDAVLADLERVLHAFVARVRGDAAVPTAGRISEAELEDHLATFLSDVAHTIGTIDLSDSADSEMLRDGTAIQRTIAERHGAQRFRLGWSDDEIRREFEILAEELSAAVRRRVSTEREAEVESAIALLEEFLARAERISRMSHRTASGETPG
jgi:hypothetical protein